MNVTAILVSYNTAALLPEAMRCLRAATAPDIQVKTVIVDNASRDDSVTVIRERFPECELITNDVNVGFGRANNMALPFVDTPYVLLLNTDAFISPGGLERSLAYMNEHPECGILGGRLVGRDGALQPSCRYFPTPWNIFLARTGLHRFFPDVRLVDDMAWDHAAVRACDWVPGCYYLVRKEVIDQVGLFDPRYFLYYEEVDHCLAAKRAGWEVHYFPGTEVVHIGGESARSDGEVTRHGQQLEALQVESELLYFRKNHGLSSMLLDALMLTLSDLLLAVKATLKGKWHIPGHFSHILLVWRICLKTKLATQPTR